MLSQIKRSIKDSIILLNIYAKNRFSLQAKLKPSLNSILLQEANEKNNIVAIFVLKTKKEYNLIKYKGVSNYLQDNDVNFNVTGYLRSIIYKSNNNSIGVDNNNNNTIKKSNKITTSSASNNNNNNTAKVAFMITSLQKQELKDAGYDTRQIKKLKPLEASLILQHQILPQNHTKDVERLVSIYHKEQEEEIKKMNQQQNILQQETDDEDGNCWYEVVQSIEENNNKDTNSINNIITTESVISL